tara:strand:- start:584 stop:868 length:285 start_codon:yes stop_codon:yes gene_type:complete
MIYFINKYSTDKKYKNIIHLGLIIITLGFLNKTIFGNNNEIQIVKVFWHEARIVHFVLFAFATILILRGKKDIGILILLLDIIFSFLYRIRINY